MHSGSVVRRRRRRGLAGPGVVTPYLGQVATRSYMPTNTNAGIPQSQSRSRHTARDNISGLQIAIPNWYVNNTTFIETGVGASATVTASVEYPVGIFTQIKFGGNASGTVSDLTTLFSDYTSVTIPKNTDFFIRIWRSNANGIVFTASVGQDTANGDIFNYGSSITDRTMGGTIPSSDVSNLSFPAAIFAYTRVPSVTLLGDSRVAGLNDTFSDTSGDKGELARAIGPVLPYINMGIPSDQLQKFVASHAQRVIIANLTSGIAFQYGINDLASGRTDAQIRTDLSTATGYFPNHKKIIVTMPASTTGAWTAIDGSDQTVKSFEADRLSNNTWRRTIPSPFVNIYDITSVVEQAGGKWKADGTPAKYTSDGVHESNFANILIRDSGTVDPTKFAR